jgi:hypothetical protein
MVLPSMVMILSVIIGRTSLLFPLQTTQTPVLPLTVEQFVQSPEPLLYNLSVLSIFVTALQTAVPNCDAKLRCQPVVVALTVDVRWRVFPVAAVR